jgi:hypothetical protein
LANFDWKAAQILVGSTACYGLTSLDRLPSLEFHELQMPVREGIPLEDNGQVQHFHCSVNWDLERNDGGRLFWLLDRALNLHPSIYDAEAEYI